MANLNEAVQLIRQGNKEEARRILEPLLKAEPGNIPTWFWYVETCSTLEQRIKTLEICLKVNPNHPQVLQALQTLRAKQGAAPQPVAQPAPEPPSPVVQSAEPPAWARPAAAAIPVQPVNPPPARIQSTSAFEFEEAEVEPVAPPAAENQGNHWQQSWDASKPAFDWEALEKETGPDPAPVMIAPLEAPKPKLRRVSRPFYRVWLTALTTQDADVYAELLDDSEAGAGRAFEWMAYTSVLTGLLSPLLMLSSAQFAQLRAMSAFQKMTETMSLTTLLVIMGLVMAVLTPIMGVIGLAINAGIQNLLGVLFGGKGTFSRTVYALAAYLVPVSLLTTLLNMIPTAGPCLSLPLAIYSLILNVRALRATHQLTVVRALMVIFAPSVIVFSLCCLLGVIFGPGISQSLRSSGY